MILGHYNKKNKTTNNQLKGLASNKNGLSQQKLPSQSSPRNEDLHIHSLTNLVNADFSQFKFHSYSPFNQTERSEKHKFYYTEYSQPNLKNSCSFLSSARKALVIDVKNLNDLNFIIFFQQNQRKD
eukprot:TRINITY_DN6408_c0_g1_i1.p3 TRINITY_DN6408_c0_g1~~TRINITY_DN6408_c0_g1_i1.p3  ORF type:complete len:126 (+),score=16.64 TRINITY_DN6408_c0_g1_i1:183-560(+)